MREKGFQPLSIIKKIEKNWMTKREEKRKKKRKKKKMVVCSSVND
jgi:hypothetical protein